MSTPEELAELRRRFSRDMARGIEALGKLGYDASIFRQMLGSYPADEAALRLVLDPQPSYGLWRLQQLGRLDTSVEMWVLLPWYEPLFSDEVRAQARRKLGSLGVDVDAELGRLVRRLSGD